MSTVRKHPRPAFASILGAAGVSALLAGAIPAGAAPDLRAQFERLDADGDGVVTLSEMSGDYSEEFGLEPGAGNAGGGVVEFGAAPGGAVESVGPILLPATGPDGERRVLVLQIMRHAGDSPRDLDLTTPWPMSGEVRAGDADGDGALSFAEFEARYTAMRAMSFALLDTDGTGFIDEAEMAANPLGGPDGGPIAEALRGIDADGDGRVTRTEYEDAV